MAETKDQRVGVMLLASSLERGGAERQIVALANSIDPAQFRVHVCSLSHDNPLAADLVAPERFHVIAKQWKYDAFLILRVARLLKRLRIDVIHSFLFDAEIIGRLSGRLTGTPAVVCSNRCPHLGRAKFKLWLARVTSGCFDMMVANSWAGREFEVTQQGIDEAKLFVIPNGVDTDRFRPKDASLRRAALKISQNAKVVGMFAHFRGNKNHAMFLEAAARVSRSCQDTVFLCVGKQDGESSDTLYGAAKRLVEKHGINDRVLFLGERSDVSELYNVCDVKVLVSNFEGTANVLLEAMACGLPTVATDVGDNARIVVDGETGFVVDVNDVDTLCDRLKRLLTEDTLRQSMGYAGRARVEKAFSIPAMAHKTCNLYLQILHSKGKLKRKVVL